ncbi:MAG: helix-turn-helix domain-containing protein [Rudanella sp.]|nr:helix-turn-helix domain-containing protein [Rudanella sp.]
MKNTIERNGLVLTSFEDLKDEWYGLQGTPSRDEYEFELKLELLSEALKQTRKSRQLTQEELGRLVGVGKAQISKLENNAKNVTFETVIKVFNALGARVKFNVELDNQFVASL